MNKIYRNDKNMKEEFLEDMRVTDEDETSILTILL
jgi:hypothetical protein